MAETIEKIVSAKQLIALLEDADQKKDKAKFIISEIGERLKNAAENGNLNKSLFALMLKLYRWDEDKRNDFLRQLPIYVEMCRDAGLFGQEHVGDMLDEMAPSYDAAAEQTAENAQRLEEGIRQYEEDMDVADPLKTSQAPRRRGRPPKALQGGEATGNYKILN